MFRLLARMMVRRGVRAHLRRDVEALLKTYAKDVRFRFPGSSSWAGEFRGIGAVRAWLERFHRVGLELEVDEILIGGWRTDDTQSQRLTGLAARWSACAYTGRKGLEGGDA